MHCLFCMLPGSWALGKWGGDFCHPTGEEANDSHRSARSSPGVSGKQRYLKWLWSGMLSIILSFKENCFAYLMKQMLLQKAIKKQNLPGGNVLSESRPHFKATWWKKNAFRFCCHKVFKTVCYEIISYLQYTCKHTHANTNAPDDSTQSSRTLIVTTCLFWVIWYSQ